MSTLIALVMTMHRTLLRSRHSTLCRTRETVEPAEGTRSPPLERARDATGNPDSLIFEFSPRSSLSSVDIDGRENQPGRRSG